MAGLPVVNRVMNVVVRRVGIEVRVLRDRLQVNLDRAVLPETDARHVVNTVAVAPATVACAKVIHAMASVVRRVVLATALADRARPPKRWTMTVGPAPTTIPSFEVALTVEVRVTENVVRRAVLASVALRPHTMARKWMIARRLMVRLPASLARVDEALVMSRGHRESLAHPANSAVPGAVPDVARVLEVLATTVVRRVVRDRTIRRVRVLKTQPVHRREIRLRAASTRAMRWRGLMCMPHVGSEVQALGRIDPSGVRADHDPTPGSPGVKVEMVDIITVGVQVRGNTLAETWRLATKIVGRENVGKKPAGSNAAGMTDTVGSIMVTGPVLTGMTRVGSAVSMSGLLNTASIATPDLASIGLIRDRRTLDSITMDLLVGHRTTWGRRAVPGLPMPIDLVARTSVLDDTSLRPAVLA